MVHDTPPPVQLKSALRTTVTFEGQGITECAGATLVVEAMGRIGWRELVEEGLPFERARSPLAYTTHEVLSAAVLGISLGARRPEHLDRFRADALPACLLGAYRLPSSVTTWRHLKEYGEEDVARLERLNLSLVSRLLADDSGPIDLDIDATPCTVYGKQEGAERGYNPQHKGKASYFPLLAACASKQLVFGHLWRPGDSGAATGDVELLSDIWSEMPIEDARRLRVRADAAHYGNELMTWCEDHQVPYVIKARKTDKMMRTVPTLDFRPVEIGKRDFEVAELRYKGYRWPRERRCVVYRERKPEVRDAQGRLFKEPAFDYTVLVTSRRLPPVELWVYYNGRAEVENLIEDLKNSIGYGAAATDEMRANRVWATLQLLAFNLLSPLTAAVARREKVRPRIRTIRERLLRVGAKIAHHSRRTFVHLKEAWAETALFHALLTTTIVACW